MPDVLIELADFLEARYAERAAWAQAASVPPDYYGPPVGPVSLADGTHWRWGVGGNWEPFELEPAVDHYAANGEDALTLVTVEEWLSGSTGRPLADALLHTDEVRAAVAGHIALHDPASVLADLEAKRAILRMARNAVTALGRGRGDFGSDNARYLAFERVLWHLAVPYAGHPDYRAERWDPRG